jgi:diguanylate cyclase (GGDEF)-like protein/PAS domain S-box-containing protein
VTVDNQGVKLSEPTGLSSRDAAADPAEHSLARILELLANRPSARLTAGAVDSRPVPVPDFVKLPREKCLPPKIFDTLDPKDYESLIDALAEARGSGHGRTQIHFTIPDSEPVTIDIFDTTEAYGVTLCVLTLDDEESTFLDRLNAYDVAPRRSRLSQNAVGMILDVDEALERALGYPPGDLIGHRSNDFVHADDLVALGDSWRAVMHEPGHPHLERIRFRAHDGSYLWFDVLQANRLEADGVIVWTFADVTGEIAAQQRVAEREQLLHQITESLPLGVMQVDAAGRVRHTNRRLAAVLGIPVTSHFDELRECVDADDNQTLGAALQLAFGGADVDVRVTVKPPHDRVRVCEVNLRSLSGESIGGGALICFTEVTESVRLQRLLEEQATHDSLTGCLNRRAILAFLQAELEREEGGPIAALFIDLDLFKKANDRFGHAAGDEILSVVGGRLAHQLRTGDEVGRLGGDEFLAVFRNVTTLAEAQKLGYRVAAALSEAVHVGGEVMPSSASVGVSWSGGVCVTAEEMVAQADAAMYKAKSLGGRTSVVHQGAELPRQANRWAGRAMSQAVRRPS